MSRQQKNAFTMHSNAHLMLSKIAATVPFGIGGIAIFPLSKGVPAGRGIQQDNNYSIHSFINLINSL